MPFRGRENNSEPNPAVENVKIVTEKTTFEVRSNHFVKLFCQFCKTNLFRRIPFHAVLFRASELALPRNLGMPWNEHFLPRNNGNRFLSLFRGIYSERNSVPNHPTSEL
jgi:hypothetical protein